VQITCVSREEASALRASASAVAPSIPAPATTHTAIETKVEPTETPGVEPSTADDETRINAVRNIFDADEVFD
jgi:hypothetical protein